MQVRAGSLSELRKAGQLRTKVGTVPVVVFWHDGRAWALDDRCPHMGFPLHRGTVEDGLVTCHWHHARFDLASGCTLDLFADDARAFDVTIEGVLVPDRERQISALLDVVEAMAGTAPTVVDLACGPGTITCRLFDRLPRARSIAVDVDPVLLTIASATFADDGRVQVVRADLRDPGWSDASPESQVDAVVTATALHWLPEDAVRRLYRDLAGLVRRGGVVAHSERMPLTDLTRLAPALAEIDQQRRARRDDRRAVGTAGGTRHHASRRSSPRWRSGARCSRPPIPPRSSRRRRTGTSRR